MGHQEPGSPGMRLHDIFHIGPEEPVFLAENSFYDQKQSPLTERYLEELAQVAGSSSNNSSVQLIDPGSRAPIAVAVYVHSQGTCHWLVLTNVTRVFRVGYLISLAVEAKLLKQTHLIYTRQ
jgi:hypothetical protein